MSQTAEEKKADIAKRAVVVKARLRSKYRSARNKVQNLVIPNEALDVEATLSRNEVMAEELLDKIVEVMQNNCELLYVDNYRGELTAVLEDVRSKYEFPKLVLALLATGIVEALMIVNLEEGKK